MTLIGFPAPVRAADVVEAEFGSARLKDDLAGAIADPANVVRIGFHAAAKTKFSATLGPDTRVTDAGAAGLTLALERGDGTDLSSLVAGHDQTKPGKPVKWSNVPLDLTGDYVLVVRATAAGTWRLQLSGVLKGTSASETRTLVPPSADPPPELAFEGLARGSVSWKLQPRVQSSRFKGAAVRIVQPDGSDLPNVALAASGKATLLVDGPHRFVYQNVSSAAGDSKASLTIAPPKLTKRTGWVRPTGTTFVPVVTKVAPSRAFNKDDALFLVITGRDFQPGADVRLVRNGRADILATALEIRSETEIQCVVDLDTADTEGKDSVGNWTVGVWNAPEYGTEGDPSTLVKESATRSLSKKLESVSSAAISLPSGVVKGTEVWFLDFNDDFQSDLNQMGLGSTDPVVRDAARNAVRAYVTLFLRDLFRANETTGALQKNVSVPVCFIVGKPGQAAGRAGEDYNRIEIGGTWQAGDPQDPAEPLAWGASGLPGSEIDFGNLRREDLTVYDAEGRRLGLGVRTRVLDPSSGSAASGWILATMPLRTKGLTVFDRRYFAPGFFPGSQADADRYRDVIEQVTRASREIAGIIAHHVGKAMGIEDGATTGPMSNPTTAGDLWPATRPLRYSDTELATLRSEAVPHQLPGTTQTLRVTWFPMVPTHQVRFGGTEECVTAVPFSARFGLVGGRPNAAVSDYLVQYVSGSNVPRGLTLSFAGLDGTAPLWANQSANVFYWGIVNFRIAVTDQVRNVTRFFQFRLDVVPNKPLLPTNLWPAVDSAINAVHSN